MKTTALLFFFALFGFSGNLFAQALYQTEFDPIQIKTDYNPVRKEYVITAIQRVLGTYSIALEFKNVQNLAPPSNFRTNVTTTLLRLKPFCTGQFTDFQLEHFYILGRNTAHPNTGIVYRLPFSQHVKEVAVDSVINLDLAAFAKAQPTNRTSFLFALSQGDTVYAARKGMVVSLGYQHIFFGEKQDPSQATTIRVEQADGTIAVYDGLEQGSVMVEPGSKVYPDTPLGKAGRLEENSYGLHFFVYYIGNASLANTYDLHTAFTSTFVDPTFATDKGNLKLTQKQTYTPVVTEELIMAEMTKKELKNR